MLLALRDHVVGRESFDLAMREYFRRWSFKHPTPGDFFRTVENVTGRDLSWFWRGFFYTTALLDVGIDSVQTEALERHDSAAKSTAMVSLHRYSRIVFPVAIRLKFANGETQDFHFPVDIWGARHDGRGPVPSRGARGRRPPVAKPSGGAGHAAGKRCVGQRTAR